MADILDKLLASEHRAGRPLRVTRDMEEDNISMACSNMVPITGFPSSNTQDTLVSSLQAIKARNDSHSSGLEWQWQKDGL
jgi:hypothetical protein